MSRTTHHTPRHRLRLDQHEPACVFFYIQDAQEALGRLSFDERIILLAELRSLGPVRTFGNTVLPCFCAYRQGAVLSHRVTGRRRMRAKDRRAAQRGELLPALRGDQSAVYWSARRTRVTGSYAATWTSSAQKQSYRALFQHTERGQEREHNLAVRRAANHWLATGGQEETPEWEDFEDECAARSLPPRQPPALDECW